MPKRTLTATTTVGTFSRTTCTPYTHVVVWNSPRARAYFDGVNAGTSERHTNGVHAQWLKNQGYAVTWHCSETTANSAARRCYGWDGSKDLIGVFPVG